MRSHISCLRFPPLTGPVPTAHFPSPGRARVSRVPNWAGRVVFPIRAYLLRPEGRFASRLRGRSLARECAAINREAVIRAGELTRRREAQSYVKHFASSAWWTHFRAFALVSCPAREVRASRDDVCGHRDGWRRVEVRRGRVGGPSLCPHRSRRNLPEASRRVRIMRGVGPAHHAGHTCPGLLWFRRVLPVLHKLWRSYGEVMPKSSVT